MPMLSMNGPVAFRDRPMRMSQLEFAPAQVDLRPPAFGQSHTIE
jgi:hypothetical protein